MKNIIIIGACGHAKVIADMIIKNGDKVVGFLDDNIEIGTKILDYDIIGKVTDINKYSKDNYFVIGIGNNSIRKRIAETYNVNYVTMIHPNAIISNFVTIGNGTVVMASAIINAGSKIGKHVIINTGAIVEHDNIIEDYVHICPNVTLAGTVTVKELTQIGVGSVVKNNIFINNNNLIGAGSLVVKDIKDTNKVYIGSPVRELVK